MNTIETQLASLAVFCRPEDKTDADGQPQSLADQLEIARARAATENPAAPAVNPTAQRGGAPAQRDESDLAKLLQAERAANSGATVRISTLEAEVASLRAKNVALADELQNYSKDAEVSKLTQDLRATRACMQLSEKNVERLEALCGMRGIPPESAVPTGDQSQSSSVRSFELRLAGCKNAAQRSALLDEFAEAVKRREVKG